MPLARLPQTTHPLRPASSASQRQRRQNSTGNCCLFCKYHHHRAAHDTTITLHMARDGTLTITYADGTSETTIPPPRQPRLPDTA